MIPSSMILNWGFLMKRLAKLFDRVRTVNLIILYLSSCVWLFMPLPANGKDSVADEIISIDAEVRHLSMGKSYRINGMIAAILQVLPFVRIQEVYILLHTTEWKANC